MKNFEIMDRVETQTVKLTFARAVLHEAENYFDDKKGRSMLPFHADQILILMQSADDFLFKMKAELEQIAADMCEEAKNGKP